MDGRPVSPTSRPQYEEIARFERDGAAPLLPASPGMADGALHIAIVIPSFHKGSGGHNSIFQMVHRWERMGHTCSIWIHDPFQEHDHMWPAVARDLIRTQFAPVEAPVFKDFSRWYGADVAVATGWQTVYPVLNRDRCRARAYLIHDHESEFYATSVESYWAERTYRLGMHSIVGSPWLRDIVVERYGGRADVFEFGVDHDVYRPLPVERQPNTVAFYAREATPRRAVPLGLLALQELRRRRPEIRLQLFGSEHEVEARFPYENMGLLAPQDLAVLYSAATVGLCLSMTNYSLIPQEMMACGLPCVDLAGFGNEAAYGPDGPVELVEFDHVALADAIEQLIDDEPLRERRSAAGRKFVADRTWNRAASQVERSFRTALRG